MARRRRDEDSGPIDLTEFWREHGLERQPNGSFRMIESLSAPGNDDPARRDTGDERHGLSGASEDGFATSSRRSASYPPARGRLLDAARKLFAEHGFESVGVREIAAEAQVDSALIHRYFGSKEALFADVLESAFANVLESAFVTDVFDGRDAGTSPGPDAFAQQLAGAAMAGEERFDGFRLVLGACGSPATRRPVAMAFQEQFVGALAGRLGGHEADLRATLVAAHVLGLYVARHALRLPGLANGNEEVVARVAATIRACSASGSKAEEHTDVGKQSAPSVVTPGAEGEIDEGVGVPFAEAMVDEAEGFVEEGLEEREDVEALETLDR